MWGLQSLALSALLAGPVASQTAAPTVISPVPPASLICHQAAEQPTVFVFLKPSSSLEQDFMKTLRKQAGGMAQADQ